MLWRKDKQTTVEKRDTQVIAVWSAPGSTGRSQVAASIAVELSNAGFKTLLIDADVYSPSQLQIFGFAENHIGIASACRLAGRQQLDSESLAAVLVDFGMPKSSLQLLPGLHLVSRWPELGYEPMLDVIEVAKQTFDFVVIDVAASLERELVDQRTLAERNAVTHACLQAANQIIGLALGESVGLARYTWAIQELKQLGVGEKLVTVINRYSPDSRTGRSLETTLERLAGVKVAGYLADDPEVFARAAEAQVPIALAPRNSSVKQVLATFTRSQLLGLDVGRRRLSKLG